MKGVREVDTAGYQEEKCAAEGLTCVKTLRAQSMLGTFKLEWSEWEAGMATNSIKDLAGVAWEYCVTLEGDCVDYYRTCLSGLPSSTLVLHCIVSTEFLLKTYLQSCHPSAQNPPMALRLRVEAKVLKIGRRAWHNLPFHHLLLLSLLSPYHSSNLVKLSTLIHFVLSALF